MEQKHQNISWLGISLMIAGVVFGYSVVVFSQENVVSMGGSCPGCQGEDCQKQDCAKGNCPKGCTGNCGAQRNVNG